MTVTCNNEGGFEDQLTTDREYRVQKIGENSYLIENDKEEERWYGRSNFTIKPL